MPKLVSERESPGAAELSEGVVAKISQKSCRVPLAWSEDPQWLESYMTDEKIYCVSITPDEETVRVQAKLGGSPRPAAFRKLKQSSVRQPPR